MKDLNPKTFIKKTIGEAMDKAEEKPAPKIDPDLL
jgi:hypothetical protein